MSTTAHLPSISTATIRRFPERATARRSPRTGQRSRLRTPIPSSAIPVATSDGTATDTDTIAITVNPVNDAPVNTVPGAQSVAEDTALPIAGVSVADIDSSALTTTLNRVANGILNVTAGAGVTGNGTASVTITGTAAQINAALAGLAYTGNLRLQRRRHAHGRDQRRDRHRHRHDRDHCQSSERRARARRCGRNLPGGCPGIAFAISQPHRRGRHRARLRRRADHRRVVSRRRRQPDRQRRHQRHGDWHHVPLGPHTACVGLHRCEFGRELPGVVADGPISIDEPQSHRLRRESATDPDLVRIGWHGRHDRRRRHSISLPTTIRRWRSPTRSPPPRTL